MEDRSYFYGGGGEISSAMVMIMDNNAREHMNLEGSEGLTGK